VESLGTSGLPGRGWAGEPAGCWTKGAHAEVRARKWYGLAPAPRARYEHL
jgi:hypothetical protein